MRKYQLWCNYLYRANVPLMDGWTLVGFYDSREKAGEALQGQVLYEHLRTIEDWYVVGVDAYGRDDK